MLVFKARIYKTGINWAVDVPRRISAQMTHVKGYIKIKGRINGFAFMQTLVPVKNSPYRLFVNSIMMKGGKTALGKTASFEIEQNHHVVKESYKMHAALKKELQRTSLTAAFNALSEARKQDCLKYLHKIKSEETRNKNLASLINQLRAGVHNVRIPHPDY